MFVEETKIVRNNRAEIYFSPKTLLQDGYFIGDEQAVSRVANVRTANAVLIVRDERSLEIKQLYFHLHTRTVIIAMIVLSKSHDRSLETDRF